VSSTTRVARIHDAIEHGLDATHVQVIDHSAAHTGHAGAEAGGGHYEVVVVSEKFEGVSRLAAQRLVYSALGDLMAAEIHALTMHTYTPDKWRERADAGSR
jgi:BolA protein